MLYVFLVEDNPLIRRSLIESIEELLQARVIGWSETEQDACSRLLQLRAEWDIALVDLFLLKGSGLGVVHCLKNRQPHQKVFVVSNYATKDMRNRAMSLGADAVFDKSTELDALIGQMAALDELQRGEAQRRPDGPRSHDA